MKAIWNGKVLAESDDTVVIEGNHYFRKEDLNMDYFKAADFKTMCPWKGTASYYSLEVDGKTNEDAAWYYPEPKDTAAIIKDRVAFWRGVEVVE